MMAVLVSRSVLWKILIVLGEVCFRVQVILATLLYQCIKHWSTADRTLACQGDPQISIYMHLVFDRRSSENRKYGCHPTGQTVRSLFQATHAVHQNLHHISYLPEGIKTPFQSVYLMSNAMVNVSCSNPPHLLSSTTSAQFPSRPSAVLSKEKPPGQTTAWTTTGYPQ
ncbi:uncharacterized protein EV420DRAFT_488033 [Desarmillaria tabescens]|uniref:Uncharacterized protein n=1 Tax=Armillaria tabescens TaxID=1929756 RepID=A0AA39MGZ2_ARMTA|nr:uncharacterized protein EV420DRAFT_488033 [Desarmillaria tabescens]KAK0433922.1 hypothetical protein EV420DRAFT_488033 [Desarmillaria tabescens]